MPDHCLYWRSHSSHLQCTAARFLVELRIPHVQLQNQEVCSPIQYLYDVDNRAHSTAPNKAASNDLPPCHKALKEIGHMVTRPDTPATEDVRITRLMGLWAFSMLPNTFFVPSKATLTMFSSGLGSSMTNGDLQHQRCN